MGWVTIRIALAHLLPGFIPTLLFLIVMGEEIKAKIFETSGFVITVYILSSIVIGIVMDLLRHKFERIFINWINLTWLKYIFALMLSKIRKHPVGFLPLNQSYQNYDKKEKESIKLWLSLQLEKHKELNEKIIGNTILEKEYKSPTITSGDRWALINILEKDSLRFMTEEYFLYYEFSFNCLLAMIFTEMINLYFLSSGRLDRDYFWIITLACSILIIVFHELAVFWLLASKRFARKLILFSLIK
jgi:hypothetical protein